MRQSIMSSDVIQKNSVVCKDKSLRASRGGLSKRDCHLKMNVLKNWKKKKNDQIKTA